VGWSLGCDSGLRNGERAHARTASAGSATVAVDATTAAAPRESAQVRKEVGEDTWWCDSGGSVCQPRAYYDLLDSAGRSQSRTASVSPPQSRPPCAARGAAGRRLQDAALGAAGATVASEAACRRNVQRAAAAMLLTTRAGLPTLAQSWHPLGGARFACDRTASQSLHVAHVTHAHARVKRRLARETAGDYGGQG
jgi:hypothetical protein